MSARTRVVIADHHPLVRASLRRLLDSIDDFEVVGEAGNGIALLELAQRLQPGLVLVDMSMPDLNGLDATARLIKQDPDIRVIVLSMHLHEEYVRQTLRLGAQGYLLKDAAPVELELAMQAVMRGETYLSSAVSRAPLGEYLRRLRSDEPLTDTLTPRQREVLRSGGAVARYGVQRLAQLAQAPTYLNALLKGDRSGAAASLTDAMDEGQSLTNACVQIVQPAMYQIGNLWQDGSITVSQEHLATAISETAMVAAYACAQFLPSNGKDAMFACVESNYHNLGLRMLSDAFETCGWDVLYLGASVSSRDLLAEVERRRPALLALSASLRQHLVVARATIEKLHAELGQACPTIWIGGLAVQSEAHVRLVGADGWAADAVHALEQL